MFKTPNAQTMIHKTQNMDVELSVICQIFVYSLNQFEHHGPLGKGQNLNHLTLGALTWLLDMVIEIDSFPMNSTVIFSVVM